MLFERTAISKKPEETIKRDLELLKNSNIKVSEYWTVLPPAQLLKEKLHKAIMLAQSRWEGKE